MTIIIPVGRGRFPDLRDFLAGRVSSQIPVQPVVSPLQVFGLSYVWEGGNWPHRPRFLRANESPTEEGKEND